MRGCLSQQVAELVLVHQVEQKPAVPVRGQEIPVILEILQQRYVIILMTTVTEV